MPDADSDKKLDDGAPTWGYGMRGDIRLVAQGMNTMAGEIRYQTYGGVALGLVAMVIMGALVYTDLNVNVNREGVALHTVTGVIPADVLPTPAGP